MDYSSSQVTVYYKLIEERKHKSDVVTSVRLEPISAVSFYNVLPLFTSTIDVK